MCMANGVGKQHMLRCRPSLSRQVCSGSVRPRGQTLEKMNARHKEALGSDIWEDFTYVSRHMPATFSWQTVGRRSLLVVLDSTTQVPPRLSSSGAISKATPVAAVVLCRSTMKSFERLAWADYGTGPRTSLMIFCFSTGRSGMYSIIQTKP